MSGSHRTSGGGYRNDDVPAVPPRGYRPAPEQSRPYQQGPYEQGGGYPVGDGYRTSGGYRTSSGGHRTASGSHRLPSGSHRVVTTEPRWGWRMALVIAGAVAGVAACAVVVVLVMGRAANTTGASSTHRSAAQKESSASSGAKTFTIVPDSCTLLANSEASKLVDSFQQNPSTAADTDQHSQCVWTNFSQGSGRQVTVELTLVGPSGNKSAVQNAHETFLTQQSGDASNGGTAIDPAQTLAAHQPLSGFGSEAYLTYSQDTSQGFGEAGVNIRTANLLVSVRYGGSAGNSPLDQQQASDGAKEAAQNVLQNVTAANP